MPSRPVQPLPRPLRALAAAVALTVVAAVPGAARADCPGATAACPYVAAAQVGQRAEGGREVVDRAREGRFGDLRGQGVRRDDVGLAHDPLLSGT